MHCVTLSLLSAALLVYGNAFKIHTCPTANTRSLELENQEKGSLQYTIPFRHTSQFLQ